MRGGTLQMIKSSAMNVIGCSTRKADLDTLENSTVEKYSYNKMVSLYLNYLRPIALYCALLRLIAPKFIKNNVQYFIKKLYLFLTEIYFLLKFN